MSTTRKTRKLGRGLSSLIEAPVNTRPPKETLADKPGNTQLQSPQAHDIAPPQQVNFEGSPETHSGDTSLMMVPVGHVLPNPYQPRREFDETAIDDLAKSIRRSGIMQPIVVRLRIEPAGHASVSPTYELVAGERRWRAAAKAGLTEIPAIVRRLDDETSAEWAIVENVQRADLNPIEKADAYAGLIQRFGMTQAQVADRVGINRSTVANLVRLADLEEPLRQLIAQGKLSTGHGKVLCGLAAGEDRVTLGRRAADESMSVRALESAAENNEQHKSLTHDNSKHKTAPGGMSRAPEIENLERQLSDHLGTKVRLITKGDGTRGTLAIDFYDLDHFDGLMSKMSFQSS